MMNCIRNMARMHAENWNDKSLLEFDYLAGVPFMKGKNKDYFHQHLEWSADYYDKVL